MKQSQLPGMSISSPSNEAAKSPSRTGHDMQQRATMNGKPVFTREAKTVMNPESAFKEKLLCDGPTFSLGDACNYSCTFCYVPDLIRKLRATAVMAGVEGKHEEIVVRRGNAIAILRGQLMDRFGRPKFKGPGQVGRVIYSSPLVDAAGNMELVRETIEACRAILELTDWHIRLLSKSNLLPKVAESISREYSTRIIYGVSTGTLDDNLARAIEQDTPLVSKRLASLHWLQDRGYRTFGMVCPSLPQADYGQFVSQMAKAIRADRCEHVWAEVINLRGESFTRTLAALRSGGFNHEADLVKAVSSNRECWELYARHTFNAWADLSILLNGKLRFLQYVTTSTRAWWSSQAKRGAVVL